MELTLYKKNEEEMINEIVSTHGDNLPTRIEDVIQIFEFTDWKAKAWKMLSDKMGKLEDQNESYNSALRSGQQWGIAALYAKKRIGEITREMKVTYESRKDGLPKEGKRFKGPIPHGNYMDAERMANNPDIVEKVISDAKKRGDIPNQSRVLAEIKFKNSKMNEAERKSRDAGKEIKRTPKAVSEYLEIMKAYRRALQFAIKVADRDLFSPESVGLIKTKHNNIKALMTELEEKIL